MFQRMIVVFLLCFPTYSWQSPDETLPIRDASKATIFIFKTCMFRRWGA